MDNIVMIPTTFIYPHPDNPRTQINDLEELTASIKANGILQNLTVIKGHYFTLDEWIKQCQAEGATKSDARCSYDKKALFDSTGYTVIIGHRRLAAAKLAGLEEVPCAIADMLPRKQVETMLLENMQRADLTIMEQVRGFQMLLDFGDSIKEIAQKTGFSERTVRRRTEIARLDPKALDKAMKRQLTLEDFDMLAKIDDVNERNRLLNHIGTGGFKYMLESAESKQENAKALPEVKKWLAEHNAINVQEKQYVWRDYVRIDGAGWQGCPLRNFKVKKKNILKGVGDEQLYYVISDTGNLSLYHKKPGTPAEEEKKPEKSAAELKKEKQMNAAWDYLIEQSRITYKLRSDFIEKLKVTRNNINAVLQGALVIGVINTYEYGEDVEDKMNAALGFPEEERNGMTEIQKALDAIKRINEPKYTQKLPKIIWALFDDGDSKITSANIWRGRWPEYKPDPELIGLYQWLEGLGYETSEVERGLVQGTDVNYHLGDAEAHK